jgi:hypothetical protein
VSTRSRVYFLATTWTAGNYEPPLFNRGLKQLRRIRVPEFDILFLVQKGKCALVSHLVSGISVYLLLFVILLELRPRPAPLENDDKIPGHARFATKGVCYVQKRGSGRPRRWHPTRCAHSATRCKRACSVKYRYILRRCKRYDRQNCRILGTSARA